MSNPYVPKIIERKEPPPVTRVIGHYTCLGTGNNPPEFGAKPCGSTLEITIDNIYTTSRGNGFDFSRDTCTTFTCPVCNYETDITLADGVRLLDPLPTKKEFMKRVNPPPQDLSSESSSSSSSSESEEEEKVESKVERPPTEYSEESDSPESSTPTPVEDWCGTKAPDQVDDPTPKKKRPRIFLSRNLRKGLKKYKIFR